MAKEIKSRRIEKPSSKENLLSSPSNEEVETARSLARELGEKLSDVKAKLYRKEKEIEELHKKMEKGNIQIKLPVDFLYDFPTQIRASKTSS